MKKVAIIGGGASGLFLALLLKDKFDVTIYEKLNILGKKLSLTGNGKGNITNLDMSSKYYNVNIDETLKNVTPLFLINLFKKYNIYLNPDDYNRVYPYTSAALFTDSIINLIKAKVKIINKEVLEIKDLCVKTDVVEKYDICVLATGSKAQVKGFNYVKTGLKYKEFKPGLTPIYVDEKYIKGLSGIRVKSSAKLFLDNKLIHQENGELQFRNDSISGIMIFQISSIISRSNYKEKKVVIDFLPQIDELKNVLKQIKENKLSYTITDSLKTLINPKIVLRILELNKMKNILELMDIDKLSYLIKNYEINLLDNLGFDYSQVCVGGILLSEINLNTFESRIKNLYVIGEALDVDGLCGGYNLHFAFSSSYIASRNILKYASDK